jgi:type VI protein secretion system component VasK
MLLPFTRYNDRRIPGIGIFDYYGKSFLIISLMLAGMALVRLPLLAGAYLLRGAFKPLASEADSAIILGLFLLVIGLIWERIAMAVVEVVEKHVANASKTRLRQQEEVNNEFGDIEYPVHIN